MKKFNRIIFIVTDSLGVGKDARTKEFGDKGASTFYHISENAELKIPTWKKLGIDNITKLTGYNKCKKPLAYTLRIQMKSNAKDTLAGHWEMMGIETKIPFPTFTDTGFPQELIDQLSKACDGKKIIGNKAASGTEIIKELGEEEIKKGHLIVYTSADPVLQIPGHEKHMGLDNLYRYGKAARKICNSRPEWNVGRVIVRPYIGETPETFKRTANRHDYAVIPPKETVLNRLQNKGIKVIGVGKINDIFSGRGIDKSYHSESNNNGMDITIDLVMKKTQDELIFTNLVDFDAKFGHRRDVEGYANAINDFDIKLTKLINAMNDDDLLIITSDHGNDPTFPGSDHTREAVPATIYSKLFKKPHHLGDTIGAGVLGNIVAKNWNVKLTDIGKDIYDELI